METHGHLIRRHGALQRGAWLALLLAAVGEASAEDALHRCATIAGDAERLACFDALAATQQPAPVPPAKSAAHKEAIVDLADPANFGLSTSQLYATPPGPAAIQARIVDLKNQNPGHSLVTLDSGQMWNVLDSDGRTSVGDQVTIKRGALGSFTMTTPSHHTYKVSRLR